MKGGDQDLYVAERAYLTQLRWSDEYVASLAVSTDADGRFSIKGVGRERIVELNYHGPTVQSRKFRVLTREATPFLVNNARRSSDWGITQFYGARFTHAAAPTKPVTGVVKDINTGKPLEGVRIACNKTADFPVHGFNGIEATSDSDGRYSLVGLPKGKGNKAIVIPAKGQPYLASAIEIPDTPGLDPVVLDVGLKHGIVIEGRVTDRDTGKPVRSIVEYNTFRDNPHLKEAPGFDRSAVWQQYVTEPDGTYRVVALAGRGLVAAMAIGAGEEYLPGVGLKVDQETLIGTVVPHNTPWNFNTFADLEVPAGATTVHSDLALERGLIQTVRIVDPGGHPVTRARTRHHMRMSNWSTPSRRPNLGSKACGVARSGVCW